MSRDEAGDSRLLEASHELSKCRNSCTQRWTIRVLVGQRPVNLSREKVEVIMKMLQVSGEFMNKEPHILKIRSVFSFLTVAICNSPFHCWMYIGPFRFFFVLGIETHRWVKLSSRWKTDRTPWLYAYATAHIYCAQKLKEIKKRSNHRE